MSGSRHEVRLHASGRAVHLVEVERSFIGHAHCSVIPETFINARDSRSLQLPRPTTMVELNKAQRAVLVDKLPDVADVAAGALVFGQFLGEHVFSLTLALSGAGIWVVLTVFAIALARRQQS